MNRQHWTLILLSFAMNCCIGVPIALSQNLSDKWVEKVAAPLVENRIADGLSIGYIEGDHWGIMHLGQANRAKEKANNRTVYEIGSVSKVFTGLLLADAVVRGEIDLNATADVVNSAGIQLPSREDRTIKWLDLSTHRSGLPRMPGNFPQAESTNPYRDYDSKKAAAFLNEYQLSRRPGDSQEYSNFAVSVLGYLVADNAGKSYGQLLRERITKPLGMTDCTVSLSKDQRKRLALPHNQYDSPTAVWTFADLPGAGGIHATMRDMMRFAKAQLTPPPGTIGEAIDLAWKQHHEADASGPAMALGWLIAGDGQTRWHNGQTGGSHSAIFINRDLKCAVVVLCNTALANEVDQLAMQLIQKAAGLEVQAKPSETSDEKSSDLAIDAELRGRLVGHYQLAPDFIFDVQDRDGHLMVGATNQPTLEVLPESPTRWSCREIGATLEFKLTETGPAPSLVLHQGGIQQTAHRIEAEKNQPGERNTTPPKISPFTDIRFEHQQVIVTYAGQTYQWLELNGIKVEDIVTSSKKQFGGQWQKRISEDLVELLWGMDHEPGNMVNLRLLDLTTKQEIFAKNAPMTKENRDAIRENRRQANEAAPMDRDEANAAIDSELRRRLEGRYQLNPNFIFDVNDRDGHLMVGITNQPTQEVYPDSATRWSYRGVDAMLEFKLSKSGPARSLILHQNGAAQTARRIK